MSSYLLANAGAWLSSTRGMLFIRSIYTVCYSITLCMCINTSPITTLEGKWGTPAKFTSFVRKHFYMNIETAHKKR
jgi:hypothetical protein